MQCFAIVREALTGVGRHAAARRIAVKLKSGGGEIRLTVQPRRRSGPGSPAGHADRPPPGMIGVGARARTAGGDVTVWSRPGEGALIEVRVLISGPAVGHTE
jgi:signal transduction histidine kinase